jgi:hypothetical protein
LPIQPDWWKQFGMPGTTDVMPACVQVHLLWSATACRDPDGLMAAARLGSSNPEAAKIIDAREVAEWSNHPSATGMFIAELSYRLD